MQIGICSYSFHQALGAGKQDIFRYIDDSKEMGATQLDPWNGHLAEIHLGDKAIDGSVDPETAGVLSSAEREYVERIKSYGESIGLPFGTIAVDGAHIYEEDPAKARANRARAYRWIEIVRIIGGNQARIDTGGREEQFDEILPAVREGYLDVIERAKPFGIEIIVENHHATTKKPDNVIKLLEAVPGLGFLHDTHNWAPGFRDEGRKRTAKYATAAHVKTLAWDDADNEIGDDAAVGIQDLLDAGYAGVWGIESTPTDGDEYGSVRKAIALIRRMVGGA